MRNWFTLKRSGLAIVSLVFALLLFLTAKTVAYNSSSNRVNLLTETYTHTLENVPIDIKYNSDEYFISGYSYEAEVYLASTNRVKLDSEINPDTRQFKVVADLTKLTEGTTKVSLDVRDLPSDVTAEVRPATMTVTLGKRVTKNFPVEAVVNEERVMPGYVYESASLDVSDVAVTSDENTIGQIARVIASLPDETSLSKDQVKESVTLQAVSEQGTILPAIITPAKAELTVNLQKLTKTVPLVVELTGQLDSSLSHINYELGFSEVIISGSQEALDETDRVLVTIDISDIKKDTRKTLTLSAEGVKVTPEVIDVKLKVTKK